MAIARYLLRFSYLGTHMRGAQKNNTNFNNSETVQGYLELAFKNFDFVPNSFALSSRTDTGVHALNSSAHVDLKPIEGHLPNQHTLLNTANMYLLRNDISIVIRDAIRVPITFHARYSAIKRIYLYRIAIYKKNPTYHPILPIEEWNKCFLLRVPKFDIDKFSDCLKLFEGLHDFETFKKYIPKQQWKRSIRSIDSIEITPGIPIITSHSLKINDILDFWDVKIEGRSFVHNQIRRMIGTAISVATGIVTIREVETMLTVPGRLSWNTKINVVPPYGLYLCDVIYPEEVLVFEESENTKEI